MLPTSSYSKIALSLPSHPNPTHHQETPSTPPARNPPIYKTCDHSDIFAIIDSNEPHHQSSQDKSPKRIRVALMDVNGATTRPPPADPPSPLSSHPNSPYSRRPLKRVLSRVLGSGSSSGLFGLQSQHPVVQPCQPSIDLQLPITAPQHEPIAAPQHGPINFNHLIPLEKKTYGGQGTFKTHQTHLALSSSPSALRQNSHNPAQTSPTRPCCKKTSKRLKAQESYNELRQRGGVDQGEEPLLNQSKFTPSIHSDLRRDAARVDSRRRNISSHLNSSAMESDLPSSRREKSLSLQPSPMDHPSSRSLVIVNDAEKPDLSGEQQVRRSADKPPPPRSPGLLRSLTLTFSFTEKRDWALLLLPALFFSVLSGLLPAYMTILIGDAFQSFADYRTSASGANRPSSITLDLANDALRQKIGKVAIKLVILGCTTFLLSLLTHTLWAINGSKICEKIQAAVYESVSQRELGWFDKGMETRYKIAPEDEEGSPVDRDLTNGYPMTRQTPAGLMARFARQTEDIRAAISGRFGLVIQYTVTMLVNIILGFTKSYKLTLAILCTIPVVAFLTVLSARLTNPLLQKHSFLESALSTEVGRMVKTISIVKAFNAQPLEIVKLVRLSAQLAKNYASLVRIWSLRIGLCQCLSLLMFVQGFGFGSKLIADQEVTAGDVNTVFWSCVVASSYLQMLLPQFSYLEKAQVAILNLIALMEHAAEPLDRKNLEENIYGLDKSKTPPGKPDLPPTLVPLPTMQQKRSRQRVSRRSWSPTSSTIISSISGNHSTNEMIGGARKSTSCSSGPPDRLNSVLVTNPPSIFNECRSTRSVESWFIPQTNRVRKLRKLIPTDFKGQLELNRVTFYYPSNEPVIAKAASKPNTMSCKLNEPNLDCVSMFFPSGDFTFIIGESGSGKSTISAVLMGLYPILNGSVDVDELGSIGWLDSDWFRNQITLVNGLTSHFLLPGTIHENIAIGVGSSRDWRTVSRQEVIDAAKFALLHEFITDLPDGYDTKLDSSSNEGVSGQDADNGAMGPGSIQSLSGGQKQRLGLARAWIRNAPVLILDEATSALDLTTQALMYDAIRRWRNNKTTICITHDLKPVGAMDYVYVMQYGRIIQNGYRYQLEAMPTSSSMFKQMSRRSANLRKSSLAGAPKEVLERNLFPRSNELRETVNSFEKLDNAQRPTKRAQVRFSEPQADSHASRLIQLNQKSKRTTLLDGFIHAMQSEGSFLAPQSSGLTPGFTPSQAPWRRSINKPPLPQEENLGRDRRLSQLETLSEEGMTIASPSKSRLLRYSTDMLKLGTRPLQVANKTQRTNASNFSDQEDDEYQAFTASVMLQASKIASDRRNQIHHQAESEDRQLQPPPERRRKWSAEELQTVANDREQNAPRKSNFKFSLNRHHKVDISTDTTSAWSLSELVKNIKPTVNCKWLTLVGCLSSLASGAMTPIFSVVLGNLLAKIDAPPPGFILKTSIYIILLAIADGFFCALRVALMEISSTKWLKNLRDVAFAKIVLQDQEWFDQSENSPPNLISRLIKDGNDGKDLIGQILPDLLTIFTLIIITFVWALILGWQLTLVGLSLAPIFFFIIGAGGRISSKFERLNKNLREQVANQFHQTISNIKAIRAMSLEPLMRERFFEAAKESRKMFIRSAPFEGISYGLNIGMTYLADGLMFYVGAILVMKGVYTFNQLTQVFSLIIFSVTFAGQLISSVPSYSKSVRATMDLIRLVSLRIGSRETKGDLTIPLKGQIEFRQVNFTYPARPDFHVLKSVTFVVEPGESVGIVGASGSGKSTIAALLHRLYEPNQGSIRLDGFNLSQIDARHVRDQIGMVTQHPVLFNATIFDNISYGHMAFIQSRNTTEMMKKQLVKSQVNRVIEQAHLSNFVESLPLKLESKVGENSDLISSGQAQRLVIARTLLNNNRKILVFDECTSALDPINQTEILKTIAEIKTGKTSLIITHKEAVMKICDRLIVMDKGRIVEQGPYHELIKRPNGFLNTLCKGGEYTT